MKSTLPVVVIGAGPVGLAAAAELVERGRDFRVIEKGATLAGAMAQWRHVRLFSPWGLNIAPAARRLLDASGWSAPAEAALPTAGELIDRYLAPLAALPALAGRITLDAEVLAISRAGAHRLQDRGRADLPFTLRLRHGSGQTETILASAVIDASGTWSQPNPMGADGLTVMGEESLGSRLAHGMPDVLGSAHADYAGARTLVVGAGHSAIQTVIALARLAEETGRGQVFWALRRSRLAALVAGSGKDQLPERGALGQVARRLVETGAVTQLAPFAATSVRQGVDGLAVAGTLAEKPFDLTVDRIIVATGFRPDLAMTRELRVSLDPVVESTPALAPLIDPNHHSCGSVPPHGVVELTHPEPDFYIVGAKSYGRAPTFLMATGYEQVRSVVAELAGDAAAARRVALVLPETGVCNTRPAAELAGATEVADGCCGGPAPLESGACCSADVLLADTGGCGCGGRTQAQVPAAGACCPA